MAFDHLHTPALLLDEARMRRNIARLRERLKPMGVQLRPHLKTAKSVPVAQLVCDGPTGPATVSTLKEAQEFAVAGITDLLYAVGIVPNKFAQVAQLVRAGAQLKLVLDNVSAASALAEFAQAEQLQLQVLLEIDSDGHRSGLRADAPELLAVAQALTAPRLPDGRAACALLGVMTHAGASYGSVSTQAKIDMAELERSQAVLAATRLRAAGHACPVVSVGSTPTAHFAQRLDGVTEVRAGVFVFFDLVMAGLGVCQTDDIALSVAATVIGHQTAKGWIIVDAGWMAMSRDRGTAKQACDQGYGLVCDAAGVPLAGGDLIMADANQEHGVLALRARSGQPLPDLPVGSLVRILPNHACATGAQHDGYQVHSPAGEVTANWPRFRGW